MKKILISILLSIPFIGFSQDLSGTGWKFFYDNGDKKIVLLEKDNTFSYLNIVSASGNEGVFFGDEDDTWTFDGKNLVILFNNGYRIISGKINQNGDVVNGSSMNKKGASGSVRLELIKF